MYDGKIDYLQNTDIVLDSNSISYSIEKDDPPYSGKISYSATPFPNTPISTDIILIYCKLRLTVIFYQATRGALALACHLQGIIF